MRGWNESRSVRASVIRDILLGRLASAPDPRGVRLRGARVVGQLDLENLVTEVHLDLSDCFLNEGLVARDACLPTLVLDGSVLENSSASTIDAQRLSASMLSLRKVVINGSVHEAAVVILEGARLGVVYCGGAAFRNDAGPAFDGDGVLVTRHLFLNEGFEAIGAGDYATVSLVAAQVGGQLRLDGATLRNCAGPVLVADGMHVSGNLSMAGGFEATASGNVAAVSLLGVRVDGELDLEGALIRNQSGAALMANNLQVSATVFLANGFAAVASDKDTAAVSLIGARLESLRADGALIRNDSGPALVADRIRVDQNVSLRKGFDATGAGPDGTLRLAGASIGGQLDCSGASLQNPSGPAFDADGLTVRLNFFLSMNSVGTGGEGAVRLVGAHVGGLWGNGASIRNDSGPALDADGLRVDRNILLASGFEAVGHGHGGAVTLRGSKIAGQLALSGASLRNHSGPALVADSVQVAQSMFLDDGFTAIGSGDTATINLAECHIGGTLLFKPARLENTSSQCPVIQLRGLMYSGLPVGLSCDEWLRLLQYGTPSYAAQPYQQLAASYRAAGHDTDVRRILITQRRDQIRRGVLANHGERAWAHLTGFTLGYGYQPWRALVFLLATVILAVSLSIGLGAQGALAHSSSSDTPGQPCDRIERVGVGIELGLPLIKAGAREHCDVTSSRVGQALTLAGWALQLLAWSFATLFIAGFTGAVRKT
jgi:hypothetical protein